MVADGYIMTMLQTNGLCYHKNTGKGNRELFTVTVIPNNVWARHWKYSNQSGTNNTMAKIRQVTLEQHRTECSKADFERWQYYVGIAETSNGNIITMDMLKTWANNPDRNLWCVFCGGELPIDAQYCCNTYKGLQPYIED
jgi:hypothetical protein